MKINVSICDIIIDVEFCKRAGRLVRPMLAHLSACVCSCILCENKKSSRNLFVYAYACV